MTAAHPTNTPAAGTRLSALSLDVEVRDHRVDWPVLRIRVDGRDPFIKVAKDWQGFDPDDMLGPGSPLVPDGAGRRVAVYRCSCGEAGCGVIAPYIVAPRRRNQVSWNDFRDYVGVFTGPTAPPVDPDCGRRWELPDLHFDRDQYLAEIGRASNDRSWETPRRQAARLLTERLRPMGLALPSGLQLATVAPAGEQEGFMLSFEARDDDVRPGLRRKWLRLNSTRIEPADAASDLAEQLLAVRPAEWLDRFGHLP